MRLIRFALAALTVAVWLQGAQAAPRVAELVIDARSGEVLHERDADVRLHPASLTKMMTLYLVFEALERGKLRLDQTVSVSKAAAAQPPSKIGFRAGQKVRVQDLIRAAAIRSANDSAVVLAEAVSGSEARFAALMTERARQIGMERSTFKNASGLTAAGHLSTVRDMALLGRRLFQDYPQYYNLFGRTQSAAFGRTLTNTNRLLGSYAGADGIKTGYTRAAGFNLVSSAERGDVRVIAAFFGGKSSAGRNARVAELLDLGFKRAPAKPRRGAASPSLVAAAPIPRQRPAAEDEDAASAALAAGVRALGAAFTPSAAAASEVDGAAEIAEIRARPRVATVRATVNAPRRAVAPTPRAGGPAVVVASRSARAGERTPPAPTPRGGARAGVGDWTLRLGAFSERDAAVAELAAAALGTMPALASAGREVREAQLGGASLFHARLTGLDGDVAAEACRRLRREGRACEAVAPRAAR